MSDASSIAETTQLSWDEEIIKLAGGRAKGALRGTIYFTRTNNGEAGFIYDTLIAFADAKETGFTAEQAAMAKRFWDNDYPRGFKEIVESHPELRDEIKKQRSSNDMKAQNYTHLTPCHPFPGHTRNRIIERDGSFRSIKPLARGL